MKGYVGGGLHGGLSTNYPVNGDVVFSGGSQWYIMMTIESFNGQRCEPSQGTFWKWFASNAFGGSGYSNTPIAAVSHVLEPGPEGVNDPARYFGFWVQNKNFGISAWNSLRTPYFQAVGDPFVRR